MGLTHSALTSTTHPSTQSGLRCQDSVHVQPYCTFDAHGHATTLYSCSPSRQYTEYAVGCTVRVPTVVRTRCVLLLRSYYVRRYTVIRICYLHFRGSLLCRDSCVHLSLSLTAHHAASRRLQTCSCLPITVYRRDASGALTGYCFGRFRPDSDSPSLTSRREHAPHHQPAVFALPAN